MIEAGLRRKERLNVLLLAAAHGILGAQVAMHVILGGLAGALLAPDAKYATLPISMMITASAMSTGLVSLLMGRFGRRAGFLLGTASGGVAGLISAWAITVGSFPLFLLGSFLIGLYQASQGYFRFAAADAASAEFRPKAISWVLAGGLGAALLGPELVQQTRSLLGTVPYAGAYLAVTAVNCLGSLVFIWLDLPLPARHGRRGGRPLRRILRQPAIVAAMLCAVISYSTMNLVMTATPLAMVAVGCSPDTAADVVRWHIVAMFGPSFFTGHLIARFGHVRVISCGLLLFATAGLVAMSDDALPNFYAALVLLGLAWNFGFIGSTSLLAASHAPEERARVQGVNDTLVFSVVVLASFASGALLDSGGWEAVQFAIFPAIAVAAAALAPLLFTGPAGAWKRI